MAFADLIHDMLYGRAGRPPEEPVVDGTQDKTLLDFFRRTARSKREHPPLTSDSWMRVSALGYMCPREEVLASLLSVHRTGVVTPDEQLTYAIGSGYHFVMQNEFLGPHKVLYGIWKCVECGEVHGTNAEPALRPDVCAGLRIASRGDGVTGTLAPCASLWFLYQEITVESQEYKLRGHPDGIIDLGDGKRLIEFKTINPDGFKNRVDMTPDVMHVIQTNMYMWMTGHKDRDALIVYQNKGGYGFRAMRVYEVEYDKKLVENTLSTITTIRRAARVGPEADLPPRLIGCDTIKSDRAKECALSKQCFGCKTKLSEAA